MSITNGYVSLAEAKEWLKINPDDAQDDPIIERAVETASRSIDRFCKRRFYLDATATARTFEATTLDTLYVTDIGSTSGLIVATDDAANGQFSTIWDASDYQTEPSYIAEKPIVTIRALSGGFPIYSNHRYGVKVTAKWGWPAVPVEVEQATVILTSRLVKRKDAPTGVEGFGEFGVVRISPTDKDVVNLIGPYQLVSVI